MDFAALFGQYDQAIITMVAYWIFSAIVQALPAPDLVAPSTGYTFFYNLMHGLAANVNLISKESSKRAIVHAKIQGTGDGTGAGTIKERKEAVAEAKKEILAISAVKLDAESSVPVKVD